MLGTLKESAQAVIPISLIVLLLHLTIAPLPFWSFILFITGGVVMILGMSLFSLGADMAMMPIGQAIGTELTKSRKLWLILISGLFLGMIVTIAEPDVQVLASQVASIVSRPVMIGAVAVGVGIFLALALLRIILQFSLAKLFIIAYILVFIAAAFTSPDLLGVAFDSSGVTTGPITVPFILALGAGVSAVRGGKSSEEDSFGLCALCSIGPILAVSILGILSKAGLSESYPAATLSEVAAFPEMIAEYWLEIQGSFIDVLTVLTPILVIFLILQVFKLKLSRNRLLRIVAGLVYTLIGLTIFLAGVNVGFMPIGTYLGHSLASGSYSWILLPLSAFLGFFVVFAEPAVHVLNKQVEELTGGNISQRVMMIGLAIGVSLSMVFATMRIIFNISIWWFLAPGFGSALILMCFTPKIFTAVSFDSGGVAAGTMAAAFILPFYIGIADALGGNVMTDAFGVIGLVAMMPIVVILVIGLVYKIKTDKAQKHHQSHKEHKETVHS
ncbi:DUF1538 domain-containing protein [Parasphaerochaeta coccoides]|uniref:DUF1538 domain-containing protein n=1 Tax=Parasphaerochaeta coccoides (strain ATCC BAA-1237 / DSM 17374 / SPN1) TaxID=760011 RepID=F4GH84_PARC1|nr:DUF1538 domain-containing protein [Parasphaerochaeta coccoides]AEC01559.1 protein of unknown function DUF1538 [Parasphaerochaeta coccoides DSM 17374]